MNIFDENSPEVLAWLEGAQEIVNADFARNYPKLPADKLSIMAGKKYLRIVRKNGWRNEDGEVLYNAGGSAHCFLDRTNGNVLFANGWKGPERKNPRGNLNDESKGLRCMGPHGAAYLR